MNVGRVTGAAGRTWLVGVVVAVAGLGVGTAGARADYQSEQQLASGLGVASPVAVNALGDVYVADQPDGDDPSANNIDLEEVFPNGSEVTIAQPGYAQGIAVDPEGDVLLAGPSGGDGVVEITPDGAQTTIDAGLGPVGDVTTDQQGDLFALTYDDGGSQVTEVKPDGNETTVAQFSQAARAIAVDGAGDVFAIVDTGPGSSNVVEAFPGGSQRILRSVEDPAEAFALATDSRGDLFVAVNGNGVLEYGTDGSLQPQLPYVDNVYGVAVDGGGDVFATSEDGTLTELPFTPDATSTSVSCGPTANVGVAQFCTATVSDTDSSDTPTGTVTFSSPGVQGGFGNSSASCTLARGSCWLTYTPAPGGLSTQTINAHYTATQSDAASTGTTSLVIGTLTPSVAMTCARPSASQLKQVSHGRAVSISCTATFRAPAGMTGVPVPTGLVTFSASPDTDVGEEIEPGKCFLKRSGATARCATKFVTATADDYTVTVAYGGDGIWLPENGQGTLDLN